MKKSELRQIIKEEIKQILTEGATDIGRGFKGTEQQLRKEFVKWQKEDRQYFGNNPYGANWSNANGLIVYANKLELKTEKAAWNYAQSLSKKWGPAIAVEYSKNKWVVGAIVPE